MSGLFTVRNIKFSIERGAAATLAALILPILLLILGVVFFATMAPSNITQLHAFTNHLALTGIKLYSFSECSDPENTSICHQEKVDAALDGIRALIDRNKSNFGDIEVSLEEDDGALYFQPVQYFHEAGGNSRSVGERLCTSYPCLKTLENDQFATAIRLSGNLSVVESSIIAFANRIFSSEHSLKTSVSATGITNPLDIALLVDTSGSLVEETHLTPGFVNSLDTGSSGPSLGGVGGVGSIGGSGEPSFGGVGGVGSLDGSESFGSRNNFFARSDSSVEDLKPSFFSIEVDFRGGTHTPINSAVSDFFADLPEERDTVGLIEDSRIHFQSDYSFQFPTYPLAKTGWDSSVSYTHLTLPTICSV